MTTLTEPFIASEWADIAVCQADYVTDANPRAAFMDEVRSYGFKTPPLPVLGKIERIEAPGDKKGKKSGWYYYSEVQDDFQPGAYIGIGVFGNWRGSPDRVVWTSKSKKSMSPAESACFADLLRAEQIAREEELKRVRAEAAAKAHAIWGEAIEAPATHPYLEAKGVQAHGVRLSRSKIVVPVLDGGELVSLQFIDVNGEKKFLSGGKTGGCSFKIDGDEHTVYVAEGFATAATLHEATGATCYAAFNANNLLEVTSAAKDAHPDAELVIAGDDDHKTDGNPGRSKASAAGDVMRCRVIFPEVDGDDTDFNDMARRQGIEAVKALLEVENNKPRPGALALTDPTTLEGAPLPDIIWLWSDWLPWGYAAALYGDGGVGKTLLAQQLMTAVATGKDFMGMPVTQCRALGYFCEDKDDELHRRQHHINQAMFVDFKDLCDMRWVSRVGEDNILMAFLREGTGNPTTAYEELRDAALAFGAKFIVLDTAADIFGGNENVRPQVRQFINLLARLADEIDGTVLMCAHPSASGISSGEGSGGSTAWNNTVRARLYLSKVEESDETVATDISNLRVLSRKKANYAKTGEEITLCWNNWAFYQPNGATLQDAVSRIEKSNAEKAADVAFMAGLDELHSQGRNVSESRNAQNYAPKAISALKSCTQSRKALESAMERLFGDKAIEVGEFGKDKYRKTRVGIVRVQNPAEPAKFLEC